MFVNCYLEQGTGLAGTYAGFQAREPTMRMATGAVSVWQLPGAPQLVGRGGLLAGPV